MISKTKQQRFFIDPIYRRMLELAPCYICVKNRDLDLLFSNSIYIKDFGGGGKSNPCYNGIHCDCYRNDICPVKKSFNDNAIHYSENTLKTKGGEILKVLIGAIPIVENDFSQVPETVLEFIIDTSMVKGAKSQLATIGQSLAYMSHSIKNILEGLQGGGEIIDAGIADSNLYLIQKGWSIVKNNISDISMVAQNILYASKERSMKIEKVPPGFIVERSVAMLASKAVALNISLLEEIAPDLPEISVDLFSIKRMLMNMILNSLEACARDPKEGQHKVIIRAMPYDDDHVKFEIEDNGTGIKEEEKENIFSEFYSTRGTMGTGLGLSVVEKIVKAHHGKIEVESTPNIGSLFRVILPVSLQEDITAELMNT